MSSLKVPVPKAVDAICEATGHAADRPRPRAIDRRSIAGGEWRSAGNVFGIQSEATRTAIGPMNFRLLSLAAVAVPSLAVGQSVPADYDLSSDYMGTWSLTVHSLVGYGVEAGCRDGDGIVGSTLPVRLVPQADGAFALLEVAEFGSPGPEVSTGVDLESGAGHGRATGTWLDGSPWSGSWLNTRTPTGTLVTELNGRIEVDCAESGLPFRMRRAFPALRPERVTIGTPDYYRFRHSDYFRRADTMPFPRPPSYYLDFGERNLTTFLTETRPGLSPVGQAFIDKVAVRLQELLEETVAARPGYFLSLEEGSGSMSDRDLEFQEFAYVTHIRAYCESGWGDVPPADQAAVILDIPLEHAANLLMFETGWSIYDDCGFEGLLRHFVGESEDLGPESGGGQ